MRKIFALLLAAALLLTPCALAETVDVQQATSDFDVTMVIPEGYTMQEERNINTLHINVTSEDQSAPEYLLSIAFSEEYAGASLVTMTEEEQNAILSLMESEYLNPTTTSYTTKEGSLVFVIDENDGESDYAVAFTVYKGYFIQVYISTPDYATLSAENVQMAIDLLGDMHFVDQ